MIQHHLDDVDDVDDADGLDDLDEKDDVVDVLIVDLDGDIICAMCEAFPHAWYIAWQEM